MSPTKVLRSPLRIVVTALAIAALALVLGACGSSGSPASESTPSTTAKPSPSSSARAGASRDTVDLKLIAYRPAELTTTAGTTVTWHQMDPGVHTVTSGTVTQSGGSVEVHPNGTFDSDELATGTNFTHRFDTPGTFTYFCRIHPATMRGEITVR